MGPPSDHSREVEALEELGHLDSIAESLRELVSISAEIRGSLHELTEILRGLTVPPQD